MAARLVPGGPGALVVLILCPWLCTSDDSCPSGGAPGTCGDKAGEEMKCVKWRQTGGCSPNGPREKHGDKNCNEEVPSGISGYCQCGSKDNKVRARESTCDHRPFKCETECLQYRRYQCISWRQTGSCKADGPREPGKDKPCDAVIPPDNSGFCECGDGRIIRKPGCEAGEFADSFRCQDECGREPDVYEDLGIDSSATEKEIKQAFRKLSLKYHPDKTKNDPKLTARFSSIRDAYDIIGDPDKRAIYDSAGASMIDAVKQGKAEKGPAMNGEIQVTLDQLYNGAEFKTQIKRKVICRGCSENPTPRCKRCTAGCANEVELRNIQMGPMVMQQQVEVKSKQKCRHDATQLSVEVERGMASGDTITFKSMGEHQPKKIPGDVVLKLKAAKHQFFTRAGDDLHADVDISLKEALLGFETSFKHLDGREIVFGYDGITKPTGVIKIEGEGMPHRGDPTQFGNLYVKVHIVMPEDQKLTEVHRAWLKENFPS